MPQKLQNITNTNWSTRTDSENGGKYSEATQSLWPSVRAWCVLFYLQRSFFICSVRFYLQRSFFICSVRFLFAAYFLCLRPSFFICSVSFLSAVFRFYLQRFFLVCSVSFFFAACPLWVIVAERGRKNNCTRRDNQNGGPVRSNYSHLDNPTEE